MQATETLLGGANVKNAVVPLAIIFISFLFISFLALAASETAVADPLVPKIVRLSPDSFLAGGPPAAYRLGIYATGADADVVVVFNRDTIAPIENAATIDLGDDNVALPADQQYLIVTVPAKFRTRPAKIEVQVSDRGRLSAPAKIFVDFARAVP